MIVANRQRVKFERLKSIDVFRGISIISTVFITMQGSKKIPRKFFDNNCCLGNHSNVFPGLKEAEWNGIEYPDLLYVFFLFIMGTSIPFTFNNREKTSKAIGNHRNLKIYLTR